MAPQIHSCVVPIVGFSAQNAMSQSPTKRQDIVYYKAEQVWVPGGNSIKLAHLSILQSSFYIHSYQLVGFHRLLSNTNWLVICIVTQSLFLLCMLYD